jgi:hypothetical protein
MTHVTTCVPSLCKSLAERLFARWQVHDEPSLNLQNKHKTPDKCISWWLQKRCAYKRRLLVHVGRRRRPWWS